MSSFRGCVWVGNMVEMYMRTVACTVCSALLYLGRVLVMRVSELVPCACIAVQQPHTSVLQAERERVNIACTWHAVLRSAGHGSYGSLAICGQYIYGTVAYICLLSELGTPPGVKEC